MYGLSAFVKSGPKNGDQCGCLENLLTRICKFRKRELAIDTDNFTIVLPSDKHAWAKLFVEFFLSSAHCSTSRCIYQQSTDDMLWYVQAAGYTSYGAPSSRLHSMLQVYRRQSKKLPSPGCKSIGWEETVYLNVLLHHVEYTLTCAVCTKTSPQNLQILKKSTLNVFASPSRRRMDLNKGDTEEIAYPHIYFSVDGYERVFADMVVRDGECVCVELCAKDKGGQFESVVFLGSIRYEVLRQVYETKGSSAWQWANRWMGQPTRRLEFVRMRGPRGKGYAEMAVAKMADEAGDSVCGVPGGSNSSHDPNSSEALLAVSEYQCRRLSDTNLAASGAMRSSSVSSASAVSAYMWRASPVKKSQSEADTSRHYPEVEANSIDDELDESSTLSRLWSVKGFGQAWHWLRETRRAQSAPLNALLTYVTLPWTSIVEDLLDNPSRPILNFGSVVHD